MDENNPAPDSGVSEQAVRQRTGGRPEYKPTDEQRATVRRFVDDKVTRAAIAKALGISPVTLRKHFGAELGRPPLVAVDRQRDLDFDGPPAPKTVPPPGRPEYEPTWREREDVRLFKADDWSDDRIARRLGISRNTLLKHFADELEDGADQVRAAVLRNLMRESNGGSVSASDRLMKLPGMVAPLERLPTPPADPPEADPQLGKKEKANREALTAAQGTSWGQILN